MAWVRATADNVKVGDIMRFRTNEYTIVQVGSIGVYANDADGIRYTFWYDRASSTFEVKKGNRNDDE